MVAWRCNVMPAVFVTVLADSAEGAWQKAVKLVGAHPPWPMNVTRAPECDQITRPLWEEY